MALPTVADLKKHLNIPSDNTVDDTELEQVLDAAIEVVEGYVGSLSPDSVTETHYGLNSGVLILRRQPVSSLTTVSIRYSTTDVVEQDVADYELDADTGIVRLSAGYGFYGTYVVTYATGRVDLPASLRL